MEAPGRIDSGYWSAGWVCFRQLCGFTRSPPAISLGYHQSNWPEYWQLTWQGAPQQLERPTGGRAVLHQGA